MTDRKQTNKYYPPDYDPSKGSLNTQLGQHVLRKRANKIGEGILVVRFELPFNAWCLTCGCHIGKGVRYNADKQQVSAIDPGSGGGAASSAPSAKGSSEPVVITPEMSRQGWKSVGGMLMYHTTKVWQFSMTCARCSGKIVIRTDPSISNYVMYSGIRAQSNLSTSTDHDAPRLLEEEEKARLKTDALFALEHGETDKARASEEQDRLRRLYEMRELRSADDFSVNQALRRVHRGVKKQYQAALKDGASLGLPFALAPATPASGEAREKEEDELLGFKRRKAVEEHGREQERERKKARRALATMHTAPSSSADAPSSSAAAASSSRASSSSAAAAAAASSRSAAPVQQAFVPSATMPFALVQPKHQRPQQTSARPKSKLTTDADLASSHQPAAAAAASSSPPASSALIGLNAYASEDEE